MSFSQSVVPAQAGTQEKFRPGGVVIGAGLVALGVAPVPLLGGIVGTPEAKEALSDGGSATIPQKSWGAPGALSHSRAVEHQR